MLETKDTNERFLTESAATSEDVVEDRELRPKSFADFIGQKRVVDNIELMVNSAKIREKAMDHVLLSGPPGLGKTSLAYLISKMLDVNLHVVSGPAVDKKGDLAAVLTNLTARDILFIDEIHRLPIAVEEILYSAMEDFRLDILIGQGSSARTMKIDLAPFTLIGATTRSGLLSRPLRDRFSMQLHFDFYEVDELNTIVSKNTNKVGVKVSTEARFLIAQMARGTPRIANRILRRVRDYAVVKKIDEMDNTNVESALHMLGIDSFGLDQMDRKILKTINEQYKGGPVGIDALSATLNEDRVTLEEVYEPYLLKIGYIIRSSRGRVISDFGKKYLDKIFGQNHSTTVNITKE
ncbi:MAG: Holliday junction branch migration DNA helicase RuvB [Oligoflexia bacterium]|nr:Holliday junction branch migration DNA helicase RuvB [Oligoflexia bacterium]